MKDAFNVLVDLMDTSLDATTIKFTAVPDELTFGTAGWLGGTRYTIEATPKTVTRKPVTTAEKDPKTVVISVTVKDKAGNSATLTVVTIMLAPRAAGESATVSLGT